MPPSPGQKCLFLPLLILFLWVELWVPRTGLLKGQFPEPLLCVGITWELVKTQVCSPYPAWQMSVWWHGLGMRSQKNYCPGALGSCPLSPRITFPCNQHSPASGAMVLWVSFWLKITLVASPQYLYAIA
jgi:hypothetical protein